MSDDDTKPSAALAEVGLDAPLCELSNPEIDEWAVRRMWEGIQRRKATPVRGVSRRWRVVALATLVPLASALVLYAGTQLDAGTLQLMASWIVAARPAPASSANSAAPAGPLLTREARRFESLEAPAVTSSVASVPLPARVDFADGSSIEAAPGARVDALASGADEFALLLRRGRASFRVTPGGPRLWRIEAGTTRVEVVGTVLSVESDDTGTTVQVDVGRVLVRSPELPGGVQSVAAGQSLRLEAAERSLEDRSLEAPVAAPGEPDPAAAPPARSPRVGRGPTKAAELWLAVDEARGDGRPARAAALLARLLRDYPADSQVALAAFTLGVLQLDRLAQPSEAAASFRRALELGIGAALREDAYLRWAEALDRAGAAARIEGVLAEYVARYPHGRHRSAIEHLLARPEEMSPAAAKGPPASRPRQTP
jgi:tetratricopeptide (TPR) repeat protein